MEAYYSPCVMFAFVTLSPISPAADRFLPYLIYFTYMKLTGITGTGSGKLGSAIFAVSKGEQIVKQYQPNVANPNTSGQVNQRARLKLMSQLAAAMAAVIAIPAEGLKSSRNLFVSKNIGLSSAANGIAQITLDNVQLTNGNRGLPAIVAKRTSDAVNISLSDSVADNIDRVVYVMFRKTSENQLQLVESIIVTEAGSTATFPGTLSYAAGDIVLYAYGMADLNSAASAKYANLFATTGEDIASLTLTRTISMSDFAFTVTRGATMYSTESEIVAVPDGYARVFVTASAGGSVAGAGTYALNSQVTVSAAGNPGYAFKGWRNNGSANYISTDANYTFTLATLADLVADFEESANVPDAPTVTSDIRYTTALVGGITISAAGGTTIRYTTDGTDPNMSSTLYEDEIDAAALPSATGVLKAVAILNGATSTVTSFNWNRTTCRLTITEAGEETGTLTIDDVAQATIPVTITRVVGQRVKLKYVPAEGQAFIGWQQGGSGGSVISSETEITYLVTSTTTITAASSQALTVTLEAGNGVSSVSGGGTFVDGQSCTAVATMQSGKTFGGWYMGETKVSGMSSYTFTVTQSVTLTAMAASGEN